MTSTARYPDFVDTVPTAPAGLDMQGRRKTRAFGQSAYGSDDIEIIPPRVVPCSALARWALAVRRWLIG